MAAARGVVAKIGPDPRRCLVSDGWADISISAGLPVGDAQSRFAKVFARSGLSTIEPIPIGVNHSIFLDTGFRFCLLVIHDKARPRSPNHIPSADNDCSNQLLRSPASFHTSCLLHAIQAVLLCVDR